MTAWAIINIVSGIIVAMIVTFKLIAYPDQFTLGERIGMGMLAAGMLLRTGPILSKGLNLPGSPFDDWSVTLLHVGLATYFVARLMRVHRHWINNDRMKRQAREYFGGIGR